jgi:glycosyltransferase involved in cell wall biosynthesis
MIIEAFTITYNEPRILPQYIEWYKKIVDKITIYDDHSTDETLEIATKAGCNIVPFGNDDFDDRLNNDVRNNSWKGSTADWIIVGDLDEFLHCPMDIRYILEKTKATIVKTQGWEIMSETDIPFVDAKMGYKEPHLDKVMCVRPNKVKAVNFTFGGHHETPEGEVVYFDNSKGLFKLLHFSGVGRDVWIKKSLRYKSRFCKWNYEVGAGIHHWGDVEQKNADFSFRLGLATTKVW